MNILDSQKKFSLKFLFENCLNEPVFHEALENKTAILNKETGFCIHEASYTVDYFVWKFLHNSGFLDFHNTTQHSISLILLLSLISTFFSLLSSSSFWLLSVGAPPSILSSLFSVFTLHSNSFSYHLYWDDFRAWVWFQTLLCISSYLPASFNSFRSTINLTHSKPNSSHFL